jgi:hypothetical protein
MKMAFVLLSLMTTLSAHSFKQTENISKDGMTLANLDSYYKDSLNITEKL